MAAKFLGSGAGLTPVDIRSDPLLDEKGKAVHGVPGPGSYHPPTTFGPHHSLPGAHRVSSPDLPVGGKHDDQQPPVVRSLLATAPAYTLASRSMPKVPLPAEDSPGPAYKPKISSYLPSDPRAVFGTGDRENSEKVFISKQHAVATAGAGSPGPGTYRATKMVKTKGNTMKFGSAPQRPGPDREACAVPSAAYALPTTLSNTSYSFAAPVSEKAELAMMTRSRSARFISSVHNIADHAELAGDEPGPGKYSPIAVELMSTFPRAATCAFGRQHRLGDHNDKEFISEEHLRREPANETSPGPAYIGPGTSLNHTGPVFGTAPRLWNAELGGNSAGPFISMQHSATLLEGTDSPGPGAYTLKSGKLRGVRGVGGDLPSYSFGDSKRDPISKSLGNRTPGPGAYQPRVEHLSRCPVAPGYKLPGRGPSTLTAPDAGELPGPGAYDVCSASDPRSSGGTKQAAWQRNSTVTAAPAWRLGSRPDTNYSTEVPGPGAYDPMLPGESAGSENAAGQNESPKRGYTFGMKDRLRFGGTTVRYQGPLAAQSEALGIESPGPGAYVTDSEGVMASTKPVVGAPKFDRAKRANPKQFISRQHVDPEATEHVPGPGSYDLDTKGINGVTSKYKNRGAFSFGSGERTNLATVKF